MRLKRPSNYIVPLRARAFTRASRLRLSALATPDHGDDMGGVRSLLERGLYSDRQRCGDINKKMQC